MLQETEKSTDAKSIAAIAAPKSIISPRPTAVIGLVTFEELQPEKIAEIRYGITPRSFMKMIGFSPDHFSEHFLQTAANLHNARYLKEPQRDLLIQYMEKQGFVIPTTPEQRRIIREQTPIHQIRGVYGFLLTAKGCEFLLKHRDPDNTSSRWRPFRDMAVVLPECNHPVIVGYKEYQTMDDFTGVSINVLHRELPRPLASLMLRYHAKYLASNISDMVNDLAAKPRDSTTTPTTNGVEVQGVEMEGERIQTQPDISDEPSLATPKDLSQPVLPDPTVPLAPRPNVGGYNSTKKTIDQHNDHQIKIAEVQAGIARQQSAIEKQTEALQQSLGKSMITFERVVDTKLLSMSDQLAVVVAEIQALSQGLSTVTETLVAMRTETTAVLREIKERIDQRIGTLGTPQPPQFTWDTSEDVRVQMQREQERAHYHAQPQYKRGSVHFPSVDLTVNNSLAPQATTKKSPFIDTTQPCDRGLADHQCGCKAKSKREKAKEVTVEQNEALNPNLPPSLKELNERGAIVGKVHLNDLVRGLVRNTVKNHDLDDSGPSSAYANKWRDIYDWLEANHFPGLTRQLGELRDSNPGGRGLKIDVLAKMNALAQVYDLVWNEYVPALAIQ